MCYGCLSDELKAAMTREEWTQMDKEGKSWSELEEMARERVRSKNAPKSQNMTEVIAISCDWECAKNYMTRDEWAPLTEKSTLELIRKRIAEKGAKKTETEPITAADMRKVAVEAKKKLEEDAFKEITDLIRRNAKAGKFVHNTGVLPSDLADILVARLIKEGYTVRLTGEKNTVGPYVEIKWE